MDGICNTEKGSCSKSGKNEKLDGLKEMDTNSNGDGTENISSSTKKIVDVNL